MKAFISWSGERSKMVAVALKQWLSDVFQGIDFFISAHDISAGSRWSHELTGALAECSFGILCLTPENVASPWVLFEAGALSKSVEAAKVVPYLLGMSPTDVKFPLAQFQCVTADNAGTLHLVESLNGSQQSPLDSDRVGRSFRKWWPDLKEKLGKIPATADLSEPSAPTRSEKDILEEILALVRQQTNMPSPLTQRAMEGNAVLDQEIRDGSTRDLRTLYEWAKSRHSPRSPLLVLLAEELARRSPIMGTFGAGFGSGFSGGAAKAGGGPTHQVTGEMQGSSGQSLPETRSSSGQ